MNKVNYSCTWLRIFKLFHLLLFSQGGADFNYLIPSTLEFHSGGDTSTQVTVAIVDDNTVEMDEEFSVQISSINSRVTVQRGTADVTITDDDGNGKLLRIHGFIL